MLRKDGDDGEPGAALLLDRLTIECEPHLASLPRPELLSDEDGDRSTRSKRLLQRQGPRLPGPQVVPIEESLDAACMEQLLDSANRFAVFAPVAQE